LNQSVTISAYAPIFESRARGLLMGLALGDALGSAGHDLPTDGPLAAGVATQLAAWTTAGVAYELRATDGEWHNAHQTILDGYRAWAIAHGARPNAGVAWPEESWASAEWLTRVQAMSAPRGSSPTTMAALQSGTPANSSGCQGMLRVLPVAALCWLYDREDDAGWQANLELAGAIAGLTHQDGTDNMPTRLAVRFLVRALFKGGPADSVIGPTPLSAGGADLSHFQDAVDLAETNPRDPKVLERIASDKTAASALAGAIYTTLSLPDRDTIRLALEFARQAPAGGGAATVTGALLGAIHGIEAVPSDLLERLEVRSIIKDLTDELLEELDNYGEERLFEDMKGTHVPAGQQSGALETTNTEQAHPVESLDAGESGQIVQLGFCLGGVIRTWDNWGGSQLWAVENAEELRALQARGLIGRTVQSEDRFREAGILFDLSNVLIVQNRFPTKVDDDEYQVEAHTFQLTPVTEPPEAERFGQIVFEELLDAVTQAVEHGIKKNEYILVELGGWDAPEVPYCLFALDKTAAEGPLSSLEASPPPAGSEHWRPHIQPGAPGVTMSAPANDGTLTVAPMLMVDAVATWERAPWDLALTFWKQASG